MYARVTMAEAPTDRVGDAGRYMREQVLPQARRLDGFKGLIALGDRASGRLMSVVFYESEEALRASEEAASRIRGGATEPMGSTVTNVGEYEVFVSEVSS